MMCKIFETGNSMLLENSINEWLSLNKDKVIHDTKYNISKNQYGTTFSCLIFYKELREVRKDKLNNINQI